MSNAKKSDTKPTLKLSKPIKLVVSIKNTTSKIEFHEGKKIHPNGKSEGPDPRWAVHLVEVEQEGMVLDVPKECCGQGQTVHLKICTQGREKELTLEVTAKVTKERFDQQSSQRGSVSLTFTQYDGKIWYQLCNTFSARQTDVARIFESLKE